MAHGVWLTHLEVLQDRFSFFNSMILMLNIRLEHSTRMQMGWQGTQVLVSWIPLSTLAWGNRFGDSA
jgi:hypothetical protein